MSEAKDKYHVAIEYLTEHPEKIRSAWFRPDVWTPDEVAQAHCLFQYATPSGQPWDRDDSACGCLTQIRAFGSDGEDPVSAWTPELTEAILSDARIPTSPWQITVEHLPVFAEWQRRLDRELNRV